MRLNLAITALTDYRSVTLAPEDAAPLLSSTDCGCDHDSALADSTSGAVSYAVDSESPASTATWSGVIGNEDELTGDGRLIEKNALRWESLPVPLRYAPEDQGAHGGAQVAGRILTISRGQDGNLNATGDFDMGSEIGREAARQVQSGYTTGVSMDLDDVSFEIRLAADYLDRMMEGPSPLDLNDEEDGAEDDNPDKNEDGSVTVIEMKSDDEVMVTTSARIRAATIVAIPAFANANIAMDADAIVPANGDGVAASSALVAGSAPVAPPAAWFSDPCLDGPTPLMIDADGRVFGHLATWGTCHTAFTDRCIEPPHSATGYAYFNTGLIMTAENTAVPVGSITMDTLHADRTLSAAQTVAHYENTGAAIAQVAVGEDAYGIWVAGAVSPRATDEQVRILRASPLSGDWRSVGGNLELQAALAVNVPGFPVPRPQGLVASGQMTSLVASGMLAPSRVFSPGSAGAFSVDDLKYLKRLIFKAKTEDIKVSAQAQSLANRVNATRVSAMARQLGIV